MESNKTDTSQINVVDIQEGKFPIKKEYRISISQIAFESIQNHSMEKNSVEICGVLIGDIYKDSEGPYLEITDIIRGEYADNKAGEVKFTHETWSHINNIKDSVFLNKRIVGWYHSHPSFGIFLSEQDMFIHNNFFYQPWQVAFVIDPISNDKGFFIWHNGKAIRSRHFWIDGEKIEKSNGNDQPQNQILENINSQIETLPKLLNKGISPYHYLFGLIIIISLLVISYFLTNKNINLLLNPFKQSIIDSNIKNRIDIEEMVLKNPLLSNLNIKVFQRGNRLWCLGKVYTLYQKELIGKFAGSFKEIESVDLRGVIATHNYTVLPNETLGKISSKVYGSSDRWQDIYRFNKGKIKNPNKIQPNIVLILPE